jgi:hypothetical protein
MNLKRCARCGALYPTAIAGRICPTCAAHRKPSTRPSVLESDPATDAKRAVLPAPRQSRSTARYPDSPPSGPPWAYHRRGIRSP